MYNDGYNEATVYLYYRKISQKGRFCCFSRGLGVLPHLVRILRAFASRDPFNSSMRLFERLFFITFDLDTRPFLCVQSVVGHSSQSAAYTVLQSFVYQRSQPSNALQTRSRFNLWSLSDSVILRLDLGLSTLTIYISRSGFILRSVRQTVPSGRSLLFPRSLHHLDI